MKTKDFNTLLNTTMLNIGSARQNLQTLLVAGFEQYKDHGNTIYLTKVYTTCIGVRALNTKLMGKFIMSMANVHIVTDKKSKEVSFRKNGKEVVVADLITVWYAYIDEAAAAKKANKAYAKKITKLINTAMKDAEQGINAHDVLKAILASDSINLNDLMEEVK